MHGAGAGATKKVIVALVGGQVLIFQALPWDAARQRPKALRTSFSTVLSTATVDNVPLSERRIGERHKARLYTFVMTHQ